MENPIKDNDPIDYEEKALLELRSGKQDSTLSRKSSPWTLLSFVIDAPLWGIVVSILDSIMGEGEFGPALFGCRLLDHFAIGLEGF